MISISILDILQGIGSKYRIRICEGTVIIIVREMYLIAEGMKGNFEAFVCFCYNFNSKEMSFNNLFF